VNQNVQQCQPMAYKSRANAMYFNYHVAEKKEKLDKYRCIASYLLEAS
jgi:hypothetical protein